VPGARPIVFLTDFGEGDFYAGILRAVAASSAPASPLIDLSHAIDPHDVNQASFVLALSLEYLPPDAVVVAVVDPGVGGARRGLIAGAAGRTIVAPDNGLLSDVLATTPAVHILALDESAVGRATGAVIRGATFHGRDVFAPVAAAIARGIAPATLASEAGGVVMLRDVPSVSIEPGTPESPTRITGTGRLIDRFGNILSDIPRSLVERTFGANPCRVVVNRTDAGPLRATYGDGAPGQLLVLFNSWDRVEVAVREGRAADRFPGLDARRIRIELNGE
jgi:S-adenosylmethionine hydrolase